MLRASVVIFGCEHRLQRGGVAFPNQPKQVRHEQQQRLFATALVELFKKHGFHFVGEELGYSDEGVVRHLARAFQCYYFKIDIPMPKRNRLSCPGGYSDEVASYEFNSREEWQANVLKCHKLREDYMVQRITEFLGDGESGLVVCGIEHVPALGSQLRNHVEVVDEFSILRVPGFDALLYGL